MSDVILVVLERPGVAAHLLRAAECLAGLTGGARVNVLAVRTPLEFAAVGAEANLSAGFLKDLAAAEDERGAALEAAFTRWTAGATEAPFTARWSSVEGPADRVVGEEGRRADFVVAARPTSGDDDATRRAFRAALFRTERPVLVVPPGATPPFGRRVAIAWRDDARAAKAVLPALRCLRGAERVHVLAGLRQGAEQLALPRILVDHDITAELHVLSIGSGAFGQALLRTRRASLARTCWSWAPTPIARCAKLSSAASRATCWPTPTCPCSCGTDGGAAVPWRGWTWKCVRHSRKGCRGRKLRHACLCGRLLSPRPGQVAGAPQALPPIPLRSAAPRASAPSGLAISSGSMRPGRGP